MLLLILTYLFVSFSCIIAGYYFHLYIAVTPAAAERKSWIIYAIWGLIIFTVSGQILQLFMPVNQYTGLLLAFVVLVISLLSKRYFRSLTDWIKNLKVEGTGIIPLAILVTVLITFLNAGPTLMDDTDSYHIQMIKWIQEYGTTPGLANLHERYGFNSSWFTFCALFIPSPSNLNFYTVVNGVLSIWIAIYLLQHALRHIQPVNGPGRFIAAGCFLVFVFAFLCWPMIRGNATTGNYDFITTCIIIVMLTELFKSTTIAGDWRSLLPELFIFPVYLFTVRVINYPLLTLSIFSLIFLIRLKHVKPLITYMIIALLAIVPFLARNVMLSGYVFYPIYQLDLFNVDWKADPVLAKDIVSYIKYFNRVNTGNLPISETAKLGTPEWIPVWFKYLFNYDKPLLVISLLAYIVAFFRIRRILKLELPVKVFLFTLLLQLISWFIVAPDPRFAYGPLLAGIFLIPYLVSLSSLSAGFEKLRVVSLGVLILAICGKLILRSKHEDRDFNLVFPAMLPNPPSTTFKLNEFTLRIPMKVLNNWNPRCYGTALPCLYQVHPGLSARGSSISNGFKIQK